MLPPLVRPLTVALLLVAAGCVRPATSNTHPAPKAEGRYFDSAARREVPFDAMIRQAARADVIFFGEQHDDPATHRAQLATLAALGNRGRPVVLSLEMFERDVQGAVDDYLAGRISEPDFLARSRPWERYMTDYRAVVELARARGWTVVASNVPRRHASSVSRKGLVALDSLTPPERVLVARDLACPRDRYYQRFAAQMSGHSAGNGPASAADSATMRSMTDRFYEAQCIKDETMAESIVQALDRAGRGAVLLHLDGAFHSDFGLGTAERVRRRRPTLRTVVISAVPVDDPAASNLADYAERGDLVILVRKPPAASSAPSAAPRR